MTGPGALAPVRDLLSHEGLRDRYSIDARFREAEGSGHDIGDVVVGYDQVVSLLGDRRLSSERVKAIVEPLGADTRRRCPLVEDTLKDIVAFLDPPDHTRIRTLLSPPFGPRAVKATNRLIADLSARLLDPLKGEREADLHRAYSYPLPALVIGALLGI